MHFISPSVSTPLGLAGWPLLYLVVFGTFALYTIYDVQFVRFRYRHGRVTRLEGRSSRQKPPG